MIHPLVSTNHPLLRTTAPRFDFGDPTTDPIQLAHDLTQSMLSHGGYGLAANQIGLPYRAFVMKTNPVIVVFNPRIVNFTDEKIELEEGCLTYPGLILKVKRARGVKVRFDQPNGDTVTQNYIDLTARIFQHETDHLNGVIFLDYVSKLKVDIAKKKLKKTKRNNDQQTHL